MSRRIRSRVVALVVVALAAAGCADGGDDSGILVDRVDDAIFALETFYRAPQDYFEISATDERLSLIVAVDDATAAEQAFWSVDGGLVEPEAVGPASGATFRSSALDFDPDDVLTRIDDELPDADIVDFAITGGPDGSVIYDASVRSEQGGTLLVRLGRDGQILGVQAR